MQPDLITAAEAAVLLRVSVSTLHEKVKAGEIEEAAKLPGLRGARLFARSHIEALAEQAKAADLAKWTEAAS